MTAISAIRAFKKQVWDHYVSHARDMPWRNTRDPYRILVSEIMLQQTQVSRVLEKYPAFLKRFPSAKALAEASQPEVLREWQGLGYNRRALNLKRACETIVRDPKFKGKFPADREALESLPGIGQSTSGALMAFAFDKPAAFIETNIRAVYLYHFFKGSASVSDADILRIVEETVDEEKPREWYYALYDYGTMMKAKLGKKKTDLHKQSRHYSKQSAFKGSNRETRSLIVKYALKHHGAFSAADLKKALAADAAIIEKNLIALGKEGFLEREAKSRWQIRI